MISHFISSSNKRVFFAFSPYRFSISSYIHLDLLDCPYKFEKRVLVTKGAFGFSSEKGKGLRKGYKENELVYSYISKVV